MKKQMRKNQIFHQDYDPTLENAAKRKLVELVFNHLSEEEWTKFGKLGKSQTNFTQYILDRVSFENFKEADLHNLSIDNLEPKKIEEIKAKTDFKADSTSMQYIKQLVKYVVDDEIHISKEKRDKIKATLRDCVRKFVPPQK